jgi:rSAM/selenodomain-associated transferase 1
VVEISGRAVVAILTRAPGAGGKTRLFDALGCPVDRTLLEAMLLDTIDGSAIPGLPQTVFVTPAHAQADVRTLVPPDLTVRAQVEGDLGVRMRHAFEVLLAAGASGVILIGSDLPTLSPDAIRNARDRMLAHARCVVLGPATDGGFYLIASTETPTPLFASIAWGGPDVLHRTMATARANRIPLELIDELADVDTPDDLRAVMNGAAVRGGVVRGERTRRWARQHFRERMD